MNRRDFLTLSGSALAAGFAPTFALANVPVPYSWSAMPPMDSRQAFIDWMAKNRGEDPTFLGERFDRFLQLIAHHDVWNDRNKRAYLMTPREDFVTKANLTRAYEWHYLDIGFGVSITGPHTVACMTNTIDPQFGEKVLEVGTGSGYQSAYLFEPHRQDLDDRDHQAALRTHRWSLCGPDRARLFRIQGNHPQERRRLLRLAGVCPVRQDHRHLRHRSRAAAAAAAAEAERRHGDSRRPAGRAARSEDRQTAGGRR